MNDENETVLIAHLSFLISARLVNVTPDSVKPKIQLFHAQMGYEFAVVVEGRAGSDMYNAQIRRMNQEAWTDAKSGTGKTLSVTITPTTPGQLQVRVQLLRKNQTYGQPVNSEKLKVKSE